MKFFVSSFIIGHTIIERYAAGSCHRSYAAQVDGIIHGKHPYPFQAVLHGIVIHESHGQYTDFLAKDFQFFKNHFPLFVGNIPADPAHFADGENDTASRGFFENIQHDFPDSPGIHEKTFKAQGISCQAEPQKMAVHAGKFMPECAQVARTFRYFDIHESFHGFRVSPAVTEGADAADAFCHIDELLEISFFHQFFKSSVDIADGRHCPDHCFIFQFQIQMNRFREDRMLGSEGDCRYFCHQLPSFL